MRRVPPLTSANTQALQILKQLGSFLTTASQPPYPQQNKYPNFGIIVKKKERIWRGIWSLVFTEEYSYQRQLLKCVIVLFVRGPFRAQHRGSRDKGVNTPTWITYTKSGVVLFLPKLTIKCTGSTGTTYCRWRVEYDRFIPLSFDTSVPYTLE